MRKLIFIILAVLTISGANMDVKKYNIEVKKVNSKIFKTVKNLFLTPKTKPNLTPFSKSQKDNLIYLQTKIAKLKDPKAFYEKYLENGISNEKINIKSLATMIEENKQRGLNAYDKPVYLAEEIAVLPKLVLKDDFSNMEDVIKQIATFDTKNIKNEALKTDFERFKKLTGKSYKNLRTGFYGNDKKTYMEAVQNKYTKFAKQLKGTPNNFKIAGMVTSALTYTMVETADQAITMKADMTYYLKKENNTANAIKSNIKKSNPSKGVDTTDKFIEDTVKKAFADTTNMTKFTDALKNAKTIDDIYAMINMFEDRNFATFAVYFIKSLDANYGNEITDFANGANVSAFSVLNNSREDYETFVKKYEDDIKIVTIHGDINCNISEEFLAKLGIKNIKSTEENRYSNKAQYIDNITSNKAGKEAYEVSIEEETEIFFANLRGKIDYAMSLETFDGLADIRDEKQRKQAELEAREANLERLKAITLAYKNNNKRLKLDNNQKRENIKNNDEVTLEVSNITKNIKDFNDLFNEFLKDTKENKNIRTLETYLENAKSGLAEIKKLDKKSDFSFFDEAIKYMKKDFEKATKVNKLV